MNISATSTCKMAYRRLVNLLPRVKESAYNLWIPYFQKPPYVLNQSVENRAKRTLYTSTPLMVKLLSVDEIFARKSLQEHLRKTEAQYSECLQAISGNLGEEQCSEDELKAKRTKVSLLAPLIQTIRELDTKQKEITETETLLKGLWRKISN